MREYVHIFNFCLVNKFCLQKYQLFVTTGNEYVASITNQGRYQMQVDLFLWNTSYLYAFYSSFFITNETLKYTLNVTGYHGTAGDSIGNGSMPGEVSNGYIFLLKINVTQYLM